MEKHIYIPLLENTRGDNIFDCLLVKNTEISEEESMKNSQFGM